MNEELPEGEKRRRAGISASMLGNQNAKGRPFTDETRALLRERSRARWDNLTPEQAEQARSSSRRALHVRWHVNRAQVVDSCELCKEV